MKNHRVLEGDITASEFLIVIAIAVNAIIIVGLLALNTFGERGDDIADRAHLMVEKGGDAQSEVLFKLADPVSIDLRFKDRESTLDIHFNSVGACFDAIADLIIIKKLNVSQINFTDIPDDIDVAGIAKKVPSFCSESIDLDKAISLTIEG